MWNLRWPLRLNLRYDNDNKNDRKMTEDNKALATPAAVCYDVATAYDWLGTFARTACRGRVFHWCVSSRGGEGPSCFWRQSCSLDTCEDVGRNEGPCGPTGRRK